MNFNETLKRYLKTPKTTYALHLDGPWGSGKTHYVKNEVQEILSNDYPEFQFVYVSLNGLKDVNEIGENVFLQLISPKASKGYVIVRGAVNLFKNLIPVGSPSEMDFSDIDSAIQKYISSKKLNNLLLCLDDLERIDDSLSIESVFGYINSNFIEHNFVKTLFISNSAEISDQEDFTLKKEKLIGRTINFSIDNNKIIFEIIKNDYSNLVPFFETNQDILTSIINSIENLNLRTIKFVNEIFDEIITIYKDKEIKNEVFLSIFTCILVIAFEYKKGTIKTKNEADENLNPLNTFKTKNTKEQETRFLNRNLVVARYYSYYDSLAEFVTTGHFNVDKLSKEINEKFMLMSEEDLSFRVIESYYDNEFNDVVINAGVVLQAAKAGYYKPMKYPSIYLRLKELKDKKIIVSEEIFNSIKAGLLISISRNTESFIDQSEHKLHQYFSGVNDENCSTLITMIVDEIKKSKEKSNIETAELIQEKLKNYDINHALHLVNSFINSKKMFEYLCEIKMPKNMLGMNNKSISLFTSILHEVYLRVSNAAEFYYVEIPFMKKFKNDLEEQMQLNELDVLKIDTLNELKNSLDKVIQHVDNKVHTEL